MRRIIPLNSIINLYLIISSVVDLSDLHIPGNTNRSDDGYKNYIEISLTSIVNFVDSKWVKFDSEHTIFRSTNVTLGNVAISIRHVRGYRGFPLPVHASSSRGMCHCWNLPRCVTGRSVVLYSTARYIILLRRLAGQTLDSCGVYNCKP